MTHQMGLPAAFPTAKRSPVLDAKARPANTGDPVPVLEVKWCPKRARVRRTWPVVRAGPFYTIEIPNFGDAALEPKRLRTAPW